MEHVLRGWNGTLLIGDSGVVIRRGLRGLLIRKRRENDLEVPFDQIESIRYAPARGVVGYVQLVQRGSSGTDDFLRTIRDRRTVTFGAHSGRWRRAAEEVAARSGAPLETAPAAAYWNTASWSAGGSRKLLLRLALHFGAIPIAFLVGLIFRSENAFILAFAIALVVSFVLRRTLAR